MPCLRGQGVRFSLWSTLLRGMQGEWKFERDTRYTPRRFSIRLRISARSIEFPVESLTRRVSRVTGSRNRPLNRRPIFHRSVIIIFLRFLAIFLFSIYRFGFVRTNGEKVSKNAESRDAMWPGSERSLNVNVRCDQGYGEAIDRAALDLVHAEIARRSSLVLDVASETGQPLLAREKSSQGLFSSALPSTFA